jgi:hypothetical protein
MVISDQMPPVKVEYDGRKGRQSKHFTDAYEARRFYVAKFKLGKKPQVKKADAP